MLSDWFIASNHAATNAAASHHVVGGMMGGRTYVSSPGLNSSQSDCGMGGVPAHGSWSWHGHGGLSTSPVPSGLYEPDQSLSLVEAMGSGMNEVSSGNVMLSGCGVEANGSTEGFDTCFPFTLDVHDHSGFSVSFKPDLSQFHTTANFTAPPLDMAALVNAADKMFMDASAMVSPTESVATSSTASDHEEDLAVVENSLRKRSLVSMMNMDEETFPDVFVAHLSAAALQKKPFVDDFATPTAGTSCVGFPLVSALHSPLGSCRSSATCSPFPSDEDADDESCVSHRMPHLVCPSKGVSFSPSKKSFKKSFSLDSVTDLVADAAVSKKKRKIMSPAMASTPVSSMTPTFPVCLSSSAVDDLSKGTAELEAGIVPLTAEAAPSGIALAEGLDADGSRKDEYTLVDLATKLQLNCRFRDCRRSLLENPKLTAQQLEVIGSMAESAPLVNYNSTNATRKMSLERFCRLVMVLVFHFGVRDGRLPSFWKRMDHELLRKIMMDHDPTMYRQWHPEVGVVAHALVKQQQLSILDAINKAQADALPRLG